MSCISTELLCIDSSWLSNLCSSMYRGPQEYIDYEFVLTSPAVSRMSGSSNLDSFHNECVIYWSSTEPSIKRCTCVNKWKNSESRWALENYITRCPDGLRQLETGCRSETQLQTADFGSLVTPNWATQAKMRKKCCCGREWTWVNITVHLHSFLTHNKHHPFENKVWEISIFIRSVFVCYWNHSLPVDCFRIYLYMYTLRT